MQLRDRHALGLLGSSLEGRAGELAAWAFWSAVEALPAFLSGRLIAAAIDGGFLRHRILAGIGFLGLLALAVVVGAWGTRQAYGRLSAVIEPFRDELVRRAVRGSLERSAQAARGDAAAVARLTQQVEIVREAYATVLMVAQGFLVTSTSAMLGLLTLLPGAMVLVLGPLVAGVVLFVAVLPGLARAQRRSILADERISQSAGSMCAGLRDIVAGGAEAQVGAALDEAIEEQARVTVALARLSAIRSLAIALGGLAPVVLILLRAPWLTRHGASAGMILGALTYVLEGVQPALQAFVRNVGNTGLWLTVTLRRIVEATGPASSARRPASPRGMAPGTVAPGTVAPRHSREDPQAADRWPGRVALRLAGVTFAYGAGAEPVLCGLDLTVAEGDRLVVVGPSGAGKSTLANLMAGLLVPQRGSVWYGSARVESLGRAELAGRRVLIPQESYVFSGTVRENLTYLREGAPDALLDHAVDALGAGPLVRRLGGYGAAVVPQQLSGGERQLLTLVRAYLSPAPVAILDEATSHLDPDAEARAEEAFAARGGTLVVVAHRIASALRARHVLVLDGTRPLLDTHDALMGQSALYRDLVGRWNEAPAPAAAGGGAAPAGLASVG